MRRWAPALAAALAFVVAALVTLLLTHDRLYESVVVPGPAMEPTVERGDYVVVDHLTFERRDPRVGDVVAYFPTFFDDATTGPRERFRALSRVLAVAGQTVVCCDAQGRVVRDGTPLDEGYARVAGQQPFCADGPECPADAAPVTVPEGRVFLASDNRTMSSDSRVALTSSQLEGSPAVVGVDLDRVDGRVLVVHSALKARLLVLGPGALVGLLLAAITFFGVRREVRGRARDRAPAGHGP